MSCRKPPRPKLLDEQMSALVLAEYVALGTVAESEIAEVLDENRGRRGLSNREIAIMFRIAELLGAYDAFRLSRRFAGPFAAIRSRVAKVEGRS